MESNADAATIFHGWFVHSTTDDDLVTMKDMVIGVNKGKIIFIEDETCLSDLMSEYNIPPGNVRHLDKRQFLMPGMVDTHIHAPQYVFAGSNMDLQLRQWLSTYTLPTEAKMKDLDFANDVCDKVVNRTLKNGTTTACYYATMYRDASDVLCKVIEKAGQRAFVGKVNMKHNTDSVYSETVEESIEETRRIMIPLQDDPIFFFRFVEGNIFKTNPLLTPIITPRSIRTCSEELIKSLGQLNQTYRLPVQTHILETRSDIIPGCQNHLDVWDEHGLLTNRTILGHCIYLSDNELDLLKLRGCGIAHCPNSNITLRSGLLDVRHVLNMGCKIGLGTDVAGGYSSSILDALRSACQISKTLAIQTDGGSYKALTYQELFRLATLGGSEVLGLEATTGSFVVGKDFDAILVDPLVADSPFDVFSTDTFSDVLQKFLFLGDDRNMIDVFVSGKRVCGNNKMENPRQPIVQKYRT